MRDTTGPSDIAAKLGIPEWEFRIIPGCTKIEYDHDKNDKNRTIHKIDLESGANLLAKCVFGARKMITSDGFVENDEIRHMHLVKDDDGRIVLIVTTMRPNETIRIISIRAASHQEKENFLGLTGV
jgi:uncharacterized DUF497 family protein